MLRFFYGDDRHYGYWQMKLLPDGGVSAECRRVEAGDGTDSVEYFLASRMNQTGWLFRAGILLFLLGCGLVCFLRIPDRNQNVA